MSMVTYRLQWYTHLCCLLEPPTKTERLIWYRKLTITKHSASY